MSTPTPSAPPPTPSADVNAIERAECACGRHKLTFFERTPAALERLAAPTLREVAPETTLRNENMPSGSLVERMRFCASALREAVGGDDRADEAAEWFNHGFMETCAAIVFEAADERDALLVRAEAAEQDTQRLDELVRMVLAWVDDEAASERCVEVTAPCHTDRDDCDDGCDDASREWLWECIGPKWGDGGRLSGQGYSLRASIDDAIAKQSDPGVIAYAARRASEEPTP